MEKISTIAWILISVFGVLGLGAFMRVRKSEKVLGFGRNIFGGIFVLLALSLFLVQAGFASQIGVNPLAIGDTGGATVNQPTVGTGPSASVLGCSIGDKLTVTLSAGDKYTGVATGGTHRYKVSADGGVTFSPATTVADAGTLTASPYNILRILWANATTTGYFSSSQDYTLGCSTVTLSPSGGLVNNGTFSSVVKNSNGEVVDGLTNANQTLAVADVKDMPILLSGQYQKEFLYGFVAVIEFNKTEIDDVLLTDGGAELPVGVVPQTFTRIFPVLDSLTKAYIVPALISNADLNLKATVDSDDVYNAGASVNGLSNVTITYFPRNMFINDKTGGTFDGPDAVDETNTLVRSAQAGTSILYYE